MSFLRNIMKMSKTDPAPEGSFRFCCLRFVNKYPSTPIQVEYVDRFTELEIAVEQIAAEGVLMKMEVCTVSLAELAGYSTPNPKVIRWGGIHHLIEDLVYGRM